MKTFSSLLGFTFMLTVFSINSAKVIEKRQSVYYPNQVVYRPYYSAGQTNQGSNLQTIAKQSSSSLNGVDPTTVTQADETLNQQCVTWQNNQRNQYNISSFTTNDQLLQVACGRAQWMADNNNFTHAYNNDYGENIAYATSKDISCTPFLQMMMNEGCRPPQLNHCTQILWIGSTSCACCARQNSQATYYSCNYTPPGNYVGQEKANLPASCGW